MFHHMPDNHHQICFVRHEDHRVLAVVKIVDDVVVVQDRSVRFVGSLGILLGVAFTNMIRRLMGCMHRRSGLISQSTVSMGGHAIKSTRSSGLAIPSTVVDLAWYPDSGATAHMTNDSVNFFMLACTMEKVRLLSIMEFLYLLHMLVVHLFWLMILVRCCLRICCMFLILGKIYCLFLSLLRTMVYSLNFIPTAAMLRI
ncbi:uncharacterized protein LOC108459663 isoform X1 [Gossypium arboreum]|uniref:uncharacterized protein LOC108459663 isoform X1 n=1 Tax=Gossypium arboreum TaxID=29729 RepID=UPI0008196236|nr:uncharacterized protein LOC108459663 isoform X1 [Gossypium arboreum]